MFMQVFIVICPLFPSVKELIKDFKGNIAVIASTFIEDVKGIYPFDSLLAWTFQWYTCISPLNPEMSHQYRIWFFIFFLINRKSLFPALQEWSFKVSSSFLWRLRRAQKDLSSPVLKVCKTYVAFSLLGIFLPSPHSHDKTLGRSG